MAWEFERKMSEEKRCWWWIRLEFHGDSLFPSTILIELFWSNLIRLCKSRKTTKTDFDSPCWPADFECRKMYLKSRWRPVKQRACCNKSWLIVFREFAKFIVYTLKLRGLHLTNANLKMFQRCLTMFVVNYGWRFVAGLCWCLHIPFWNLLEGKKGNFKKLVQKFIIWVPIRKNNTPSSCNPPWNSSFFLKKNHFSIFLTLLILLKPLLFSWHPTSTLIYYLRLLSHLTRFSQTSASHAASKQKSKQQTVQRRFRAISIFLGITRVNKLELNLLWKSSKSPGNWRKIFGKLLTDWVEIRDKLKTFLWVQWNIRYWTRRNSLVFDEVFQLSETWKKIVSL